jgi:hypothetical protein
MSLNNVYNLRIQQHCSKCEWWNKLRCRKGHLATSPSGCPIRKFEPINGAGYDDDREPEPPVNDMPPCCGHSTDMPDLSWGQVLAMFAQAMVRWVKAGMPLAPDQVHADRLRKCDVCPHRKNFWCQKCKCVCYLKSKVATEQCPDDKPRWLRL